MLLHVDILFHQMKGPRKFFGHPFPAESTNVVKRQRRSEIMSQNYVRFYQ